MKREADTLRQLQISDQALDLDSSSDEEFSINPRRHSARITRAMDTTQAVVESVSPGGHVVKRRTRSRPVSLELMPPPLPPILLPESSFSAKKKGHKRNQSSTSTTVSDQGSPMKVNDRVRPEFGRLPSSATLFFGPSIGQSGDRKSREPENSVAPLGRSSVGSLLPTTTPEGVVTANGDTDPFNGNPSDSSFTSACTKANASFAFSIINSSPPSRLSSPRNRIPKKYKKPRDSGVVLSDDEGDLSFSQPVFPLSKSRHSLQPLSVRGATESRPAASKSTSSEATLFDDTLVTPCHEPGPESAWPSDGDVTMENIDEFIVKTLEAGAKDEGAAKRIPNTPQKKVKAAYLGLPAVRPWASAVTGKIDRTPLFGEKLRAPQFFPGSGSSTRSSESNFTSDSGSVRAREPPKKVLLAPSKPRKSCPGDLKFPSLVQHTFQQDLDRGGKFVMNDDTSEENSPLFSQASVTSRNRTYGNVGLGRPVVSNGGKFNTPSILMRRSSSGQYSTSSEASDATSVGTPTKATSHGKLSASQFNDYENEILPTEWKIPALRIKTNNTLSNNTQQHTLFSSNQTPIFNSPFGARQSTKGNITAVGKRTSHTKENQRPTTHVRTLSNASTADVSSKFSTQPTNRARYHGDVRDVFQQQEAVRSHDQRGRFERDFVEVDVIGAGEFGSVIKVRYKDDHEDKVLAVKKSRRFEGNRHR